MPRLGDATDGRAEMLGGGLGDYAPGEYSDDTQMAVIIAEVSSRGLDLTSAEALDQIADGFIAWAADGPADIGIQTAKVLRGTSPGPGSADSIRRACAALAVAGERTGGNGALMRTGIVGLTRLLDRQATARAARAVAELTHADPDAGDSCVLWSEAVRVAVLDGRFAVDSGLDLLPVERRHLWADRLEAAARGGARPRSEQRLDRRGAAGRVDGDRLHAGEPARAGVARRGPHGKRHGHRRGDRRSAAGRSVGRQRRAGRLARPGARHRRPASR
ncbi:MAG: ADP-ribosylglycohydrolase family protein [Quadrisphaera sp.]